MGSRRVRRVTTTICAVVVVLLVTVGLVSGLFGRAGRGVLYATGLYVDGGAPTVDPTLFESTPEPTPEPVTPGPVLASADEGTAPEADALARRIAAVDKKDVGSVGGVVLDPATGKTLYARQAERAKIPASTMKVLTSTAALDVLGPDHRFTTKVVTGAEGQIVLVGGGDPYLMSKPDRATPDRADLTTLAAETASQLKEKGQTQVTLGYDASLFTGPGWNPAWLDKYADEATTVSALWVDLGREGGQTPSRRDTDPPKAAADEFTALLTKQGVKVTRTAAAKAPDGAAEITTATSEPLDLIVESVMLHSNNDAAEVLFRHVALGSGRPGSNTDASAAVQQRLTDLGVWVDGAVIKDGSGLSRDNGIPPAMLAKVVALALDDENPGLRSVITGMPVAAADGSLRVRYFSEGTEAGRGHVRAKTGTLSKVHALAGYTRTADGRLLVMAFLVNGGEDFPDRVHLDRVTSAVTACGC
ncbi:D-alanyl-D-alanine carboxypeptidase/D-alanyl-D-alanine endopeptidase [Propionibacteriaceae bacterium Y1685]